MRNEEAKETAEHKTKEEETFCHKKSSSPPNKKKDYYGFRKRAHSFRMFISYFYVEQNENPFHALIGPGPDHPKTFSLSHLWYVFIICFIPVCSLLSTLGFIQPYLASDNTLCDWKKQPELCQSVIVVFITYRIGFSTTLFFLFTAMILGKSSSRNSILKTDGLSTLHTGFWIEKVIIVLVLSCVSFAFPPVIFDTIWIYGVLLGDIFLTCIMLFLFCDFVRYLHCKALYHIDNRKCVYLNRTFLTNVEYALAIVIKIGFLLGSIYTISTSTNNQWVLVFTTLMTIYLNGQLLHVILHQKEELLCTLYATGFTFVLTWVTIVNHKQYGENCSQNWQAIWSPTNIVSLVLVYTVIIYSLLRRDEPYHFYYFFWTICRGDGTIIRFEEHQNESKQKEDRPSKTYQNLNDTLLDQSPEGLLGPTPRKDKQQQQQQQQQQQHQQQKQHNEAVYYSTKNSAMYSESFIHLFFAMLSMKTTAAVTNYNILVNDKYENLATAKALSSIVALYISTIFVVILFTSYLYRVKVHTNIDPFSVGLLLKAIFQNLGNMTSSILLGVPKCLQESLLCRWVYSLFFTLVFTMACFVISPPFRKYFERLSFFCDHVTVFGACMSRDPAFVSLYRIFGTVGMFFAILAWLTVDVYPITKLRSKIHKGCWLIKFTLLLFIFTCIVNLPSTYSRYWLYFSLVSILVVTLLQLSCLIDAVSLVSDLCRSTDSNVMFPTKKIAVGSASLTLLLYVISLTAYVCFYVFYAHNYTCAVTRLFVSVNLVLCITASIISIHPIINNGGLLLSAMVTSFCMYSTWSALNYNPMEKCNPLAHTLLLVESRPSRDVVSAMDLCVMFVTFVYFNIRIRDISKRAFDASLLSTIYSLLNKSKVDMNLPPKNTEPPLLENLSIGEVEEKAQIEKWLAECRDTTTDEEYPTPPQQLQQQQSVESIPMVQGATIENSSTEHGTTFEKIPSMYGVTIENSPTQHGAITDSPNNNKKAIKSTEEIVNNVWRYQSPNTDKVDPESGILPQDPPTNYVKNYSADDLTRDSTKLKNGDEAKNINNNADARSYSYSCLHFVCCMATSYSFLLLAHWLEPVPGSGFKISLHWAIMSVKLVSSTLSVLVYIWYMMVPVIDNRLSK